MPETKIFALDPVTHTIEAPIFENHKRGKNWMAVVEPDARAPGGLARTFYPSARGESGRYVVDGLTLCAVEFGADYYSASGRKSSTRWYGAVVEVRQDAVGVERCETGRKAWEAAEAAKAAWVKQNRDSLLAAESERMRQDPGSMLQQPAHEGFLTAFTDDQLADELVRRGFSVQRVSQDAGFSSQEEWEVVAERSQDQGHPVGGYPTDIAD